MTGDPTHLSRRESQIMEIVYELGRATAAEVRDRMPDPPSYSAVREQATLDDIGFVQQSELFDTVKAMTDATPIVIDSREFLLDPEAMLRRLCARLDIDFDPAMLSWPAGPRDSDGVWGKYWYDSVWQSTGFAPYRERNYDLHAREAAIAAQARPYYERLYRQRLQP